jgi:formylglycine-generating enzyme
MTFRLGDGWLMQSHPVFSGGELNAETLGRQGAVARPDSLIMGLLPLIFLSASCFLPAQEEPNQVPKSLRINGIDLVLIPHGEFVQGSPTSEPGREADEGVRRVTISSDFYMSETPITRGQWQRFVDETRHRTEAEQGTSGGYGMQNGRLVQGKHFTWRNPGFAQGDDHPVVMVTWNDAQAFCRWLSGRSRRRITLPSETQWEYACRAGSKELRYAQPLNAVAWHRGNADGRTHPAGQKQANAWGLKDMYGPVWQWCDDWYAPYDGGVLKDPIQNNSELSDKPRRVLRGGSFLSDPNRARSAERYRNDARSRNADNGFRVVASVERAAEPAAAIPVKKEPGRASAMRQQAEGAKPSTSS